MAVKRGTIMKWGRRRARVGDAQGEATSRRLRPLPPPDTSRRLHPFLRRTPPAACAPLGMARVRSRDRVGGEDGDWGGQAEKRDEGRTRLGSPLAPAHLSRPPPSTRSSETKQRDMKRTVPFRFQANSYALGSETRYT
jgi:hypothetical protein